MPSKVTAVADAVVQELTQAPDGTFSQTFTVVRKYLPRFDLATADGILVTVVPSGMRNERVARGLVQKEFDVDIGIQKHLADPDADGEGATQAERDELDGLVALVEEFVDFFEPNDVFAGCQLVQPAANDPLWSPEHLQNDRTFTSVMRLTVRLLG